MHIDLTKEVDGDLTLREGLLVSLGRHTLVRESRVLKELANLRERIVDSKSDKFQLSAIELKYCVNSILLSDYSKDVKFALLGVLDDHAK